MRRISMLCAVVTWTAIAASGSAFGETAREIIDAAKKVNDARAPKDAVANATMTIFDASGKTRVREMQSRGKYGEGGSVKTITFFVAPPEVKGIGLLTWGNRGGKKEEDMQWVYFPEYKRTQRITANDRSQSVQGSDITYEDLRLLQESMDWTEAETKSRLLKDAEVVDGSPCAVIELTVQNDRWSYGRFVAWLDRAKAMPRKLEMYSRADGKLLKTLKIQEIKDIDSLPTATHFELSNVQKGTKTVIEVSGVSFNKGLDDAIFTERYLERGPNPAVAGK